MGILGHFKDMHIADGAVHIHQTGAKIKIDRHFWADTAAIIKLNSYIVTMRIGRFLRGKRPVGTIAFYPQPSGPWYNAWLTARFAGLKFIQDPQEADRVFIFDDSTTSDIGADLSEDIRTKAINHRITDISKEHVADVFEQVFGYSLRIDPLTHTGPAVQKSDANGTHDGVVINCPIAPADLREDCAYQKLVDSVNNGTQSEDLRLAIVGDQISVVFHKFKDLGKRFGTDYAQVDVVEAKDVFSETERELILTFCQKMGLDFGAIDVMRDKNDGRIYIVDVNKTCMPVLCLKLRVQTSCFRKIGKAFLTMG